MPSRSERLAKGYGYYVSSKHSQCFHDPNCARTSTYYVWPENMLFRYFSHQEGIDAGKRPCKECIG